MPVLYVLVVGAFVNSFQRLKMIDVISQRVTEVSVTRRKEPETSDKSPVAVGPFSITDDDAQTHSIQSVLQHRASFPSVNPPHSNCLSQVTMVATDRNLVK